MGVPSAFFSGSRFFPDVRTAQSVARASRFARRVSSHEFPRPRAPDREQLTAYGLGQLAEAASAPIQEHLEACAGCRAVVEAVPDDTLASLVRATAPLLLDALSASRPPENPRASDGRTATEAAPSPVGPGTAAVPADLLRHPRYQITDLLGSGGMGCVYRAEHRLMGRTVALKVIHKSLTSKPGLVDRFRREVRAAARLAHPNIVTAYDADQAGDTHFLVMEFVEGTDLARLVRQGGPLPAALACDYVRQAALGLQHAHERGLVHRDIKPSNLMLTAGGQVKVLDFGLALLVSENAAGDLTDTGVVMGTADYIAPEQADDTHRADVRADIYSLGCTLYFLLTGRPPFPEGNFMQKVMAHSRRTPRPLTDFRGDLPPGLEQVLGRMTAKEPARRYQTPGEAARALARFATADGTRGTAPAIEARPRGEADLATEAVPAASRPSHRRRLRPLVPAALAVLLAGAGLLGLVVYRIATDKGEVVIETDDPDVKVVVKQGGKVVTILDPRSKQKVTLDTGQYTVSLSGNPDGLKIDLPETFSLRRGDTKIVTVKRVEEKVREVRRFDTDVEHVLVVAFSPDGRQILSGGDRGTLRLWDVATGQEIRNFQGHNGWIVGVAFSPDGRYALSGSYDKTVRLWEAATGKEVRRFEGHTSAASPVAFSPDGKFALSGGQENDGAKDPRLLYWDVQTGKLLRGLEGHTETVTSVAFSPDGRQGLSASSDKTVRLWDLETGQEMRKFEGHESVVHRAVFAPDGRTVLSGSGDRTIRLWDMTTGKELRRFEGHANEVYYVDFSPDGRRFLSTAAEEERTVRLWDVASGKEVFRIQGLFRNARFSPDGRYAAAGSFREGVVLWRLPDPPPPKKGPEGRRPK
jgi:eukaryotic-like serine/threonine-protein kinase